MTAETNYLKYKGKMKVADLIDLDYHLLSILARLNIKLGFGEMNIEEMCKKNNLSIDLFLLICRIYSFPGFTPSLDNMKSGDLRSILSYLHASHVYYMSIVLPRLENKLKKMGDSCSEIHKKILSNFYESYYKELNKHFSFEEKIVFRYVEQLLKHENSENFNIEKFERHHTDIDEKLSDLKNIIIKYLPEDCPTSLRNEVLFDLFQFEEDLTKHTLIENKLFIPLVAKLENSDEKVEPKK